MQIVFEFETLLRRGRLRHGLGYSVQGIVKYRQHLAGERIETLSNLHIVLKQGHGIHYNRIVNIFTGLLEDV